MSSQVLSLTQAFCNRIVVRLSQQPHFTLIGRSWDVLLEATSTSICSPARNQKRCPQVSAIGVADSKHSRSYAHDADIGVAVVRVWERRLNIFCIGCIWHHWCFYFTFIFCFTGVGAREARRSRVASETSFFKGHVSLRSVLSATYKGSFVRRRTGTRKSCIISLIHC